jgi:hypothetical protein
MFKIVKFDLLLKYVALLTIVISITIYSLVKAYLDTNVELFKLITISSAVSTAIILLLLSPSVSRIIWGWWAFFNKSLYPDLNGSWVGEIELENGNKLPVKAIIRQSLLSTEIDLHGETTKSITLETTPTIEKGQKKLYYVYRSTPKNSNWPSYNGSTLFDIRQIEADKKTSLELSGSYYTDRKTIGRIYLRQICTDSNKDVSFY